MNWRELISDLDIRESGGTGDPVVGDIQYDSRRVTPGAVYVAVPGRATQGDRFIADAVARGAVAVVSQNTCAAYAVPWVRLDEPRKAAGRLAAKLWDIRWNDIVSVGITGTNGKTTVAHLFHHLFTQTYGAEKAWMFGTISYRLGTRVYDAHHTTPESCDVFRHIGTASQRPAAIVMEASSHALALDRLEGCRFDVGVFTNLSQDHLDFHPDMEDYYQAKKKLFTEHLKKNGTAVINVDDSWGCRLSRDLDGIGQVTFGRNGHAAVRIADCSCGWNETVITIHEEDKEMKIQSNLSGLFNVYNLVALWAGARALQHSADSIAKSAATASVVHGRMERVNIPTEFTMIVDYAHSPDALEKVLSAARPLTKGRLICVFGCGGDRDRTKRPRMAEAVAEVADEAVVTSDNPRSEDPMEIINEILRGIPLDFPYHVVADRREGIRKAMQLASAGDCIVVAGKGHETYQEIKGVRHHFDDYEVICELGAGMKKAEINA